MIRPPASAAPPRLLTGLLLGLAAAGCSSDFDHVPPPRQGPTGGTGGGSGGGGTGTVDDTGLPVHTDDTGGGGGEGTGDDGSTGVDDTGEAPDPVGQACYLGPDRDDSVCVDVVDYDPAWGSDYSYPEPYGGDPQYDAPARYVDLLSVDADLELAPNFVLGEVMQDWKGRYGVFQTHTLSYLQDLRDLSGGALVVNSGYRNVAYNASVGGVTYSRHQYGDAADLDPSAVSLDTLGELCEDLGASYVGMYSTHVHCDWRYDPLDPAFFDPAKITSLVPAPLPVHTARVELGADGRFTAPATGYDEGEPLRRWVARDLTGAVIGRDEGEVFEAPLGTVRVEVEVGGRWGDRAVWELGD